MSTGLRFDVLVIGGGQAGIPLAWSLAGKGMRVGLAERKLLGGSCVNFGCTPTKAALTSARVAHLARRATEFGLRIPTVEVDFGAVMRRANDVAAESREGLERDLGGSDNPKWLRAAARIEGREGENFRIDVGGEKVWAKQVVVNTGTRSAKPKIAGLEKLPFLDSGNWIHQQELPEKLAMIGGGYIGLEMAQFYRRMGSTVTVWESGPQILEREDEDVTEALQGFLESEGIVFRTGVKIASADELKATHVFAATGRQANSDDLGLESIGVACDEHGYLKVDETLATNVKGIWAAGDIRGGPMFTHTSWDDFRILQSQMAGDKSRTTKRIVPYAVFTDPELGRVGMTEKEANEKGLQFQACRFEMKKNGKARELGEEGGFIKALIENGTEKILGVALLCAEASELVHIFIDLMNANAPASVLRNAIHIHPTLAEAVQSSVK